MAVSSGLKFLEKVNGFESHISEYVSPSVLDFGKTVKQRSRFTERLIERDLMGFKNDTERNTDPFFQLAIYKTLELFKLPEHSKILHLISLFLQDIDIWNVSAGLPWIDQGYKMRGDIQRDPDAIRRVRKFWHKIKDREELQLPDCMVFVHYEEYNIRIETLYPATVTFGEAMFALPLIRAYQRGPQMFKPITYGFETATDVMEKITDRFQVISQKCIAISFKNFDKTVPAWLISMAFAILMLNIDCTKYEGYGIPDTSKIYVMFKKIQDYFINTKLRTAGGKRFVKDCGIPSGSYFTQLVRSIVNSFLINWFSLSRFGEFPTDCVFIGNASLVSSRHFWDLRYCNKLAKQVGMEIDMTKSCVADRLDEVKHLNYYISKLNV